MEICPVCGRHGCSKGHYGLAVIAVIAITVATPLAIIGKFVKKVVK